MLALSVTFLALYFALPVRTNDALYIDIRALVPAVLFLVMGLLALPVPNDEHPRSMAAAALPAAFLIALSNLAIIAAHFAAESAWIAGYRQIVASIPAGSRVLPVTPKLATPFTHAGSAVVIDTGGVIPYLFSGDVGNPMKHFRYIHRPYAPAEGWYGQHAASVDWGQIGCAYEYLLLIKPYDPARVGVATSPVAENSSAALVKLDPHACRRSQAQGI